MGYDSGKMHIAVCGPSDCGKSTFIKAVRGKCSHVHDVPDEKGRYIDCFLHPLLVWYEVTTGSDEYQDNFPMLHAFDAIILLSDSAGGFDASILSIARNYHGPIMLVRTERFSDEAPDEKVQERDMAEGKDVFFVSTERMREDAERGFGKEGCGAEETRLLAAIYTAVSVRFDV
jgi:energy-coupling factor transporter ATP-binding protein EcfA2